MLYNMVRFHDLEKIYEMCETFKLDIFFRE